MKLFKMVTLNFVCIVVASRCALAESIEARFEERYTAWRSWVETNSFLSVYTGCKAYHDIIALGVPALPLMINKMEERFDDFHLGRAVGIISKRQFGKEEWPVEKLGDSISASKMYIKWWRVGRFQTETRFKELYKQWCTHYSEKKDDDAKKVYRRIVNLGLPVLPCLVGIVDEHSEFVAAVSELTDGALPKNAKPDECKAWWKENKERFTLPPLSPSEENSAPSPDLDGFRGAPSPGCVSAGSELGGKTNQCIKTHQM